MTFEITGFDGSRGRVLIETKIGRFWIDFSLIENSTVLFDDADTMIDEDILKKSTILQDINYLDLEEFVLESDEVQEQIRENRFFSEACHGDYYDYYGVFRKDFC
jgi:hypothetical protein